MRCLALVSCLLLGALPVGLAGCGGDGGAASLERAGPPAPSTCLERWNGDEAALGFGKHAYSPGHDSRGGRAFIVDDPDKGLEDTCVVVFAASESDREYGILGWFSKSERTAGEPVQGGWEVISYYPVESQQERIDLQRTGAEKANVALAADGKVTPLE
jgi:hypothetical protein